MLEIILAYLVGLLSGILGLFWWAVIRISGKESRKEEREVSEKQ